MKNKIKVTLSIDKKVMDIIYFYKSQGYTINISNITEEALKEYIKNNGWRIFSKFNR